MYLAVGDLMDEDDDTLPVWDDPKVEELRSQVLEHDSYDVVPLPADRKAIGSKWVVKRKPDKDKARFTPKGCAQKKNIDYKETWAPVAKLTTLRIFLTIVALLQLATGQLDLKTAFLNATLEEEIYCRPLHDHLSVLVRLLKTLVVDWQRSRVLQQIRALRRGGVLRLKKAVYGLKQAPRAWWLKLHTFLQQLGFKANKSDVCLYVMHVAGGAVVLLLLYVDDIIVAASTAALVEHYTALISRTFRVSSEGPLTSYLGFDVRVDVASRRVYISMKRYVEKVFKRFKLVAKQSVLTPLQEGIEAALPDAPLADAQFTEDFEYREEVGSILYYMLGMRPYISFAIGLLTRFSTKVNRVAAAGMTHLLHFVFKLQ